MNVKKLTQLAMLAAVSIVLMYFVRIPFPPAPFIEYTPSEAVHILAALFFGPLSALVLTVVVALLQGFTVSAAAGPIGIIMNVVGSGSFVLVIGLIARRNKTNKRVLIALLAGIIATVAAMVLWNYILTPLFMTEVPREVVVAMLPTVFLPYNLMRAALNAALGFVAWKALAPHMKKFIGE